MSAGMLDLKTVVEEARAEGSRRAAHEPVWDTVPSIDELFRIEREGFAVAPEAVAFVPSGRPLAVRGRFPRLRVNAKRALRRSLAWYIHPITEQQSRFNAAIVAEMRRLERRLEGLEAASSAQRVSAEPVAAAAARSTRHQRLPRSGRLRAVHQLVPVMSPGDGVTSVVLRLRDILRSKGYRSDIYSPLVHPRLRREARASDALSDSLADGTAVLYHLSIGSPLADEFQNLAAPRIVYYQNITPAASVEQWSPVLAHHLRWGRSDLERLAPIAELSLAPSEFSARELRDAGAEPVVVVPLPVSLARLRPRAAAGRGPLSLLFVGRFAPHKRQDALIKVLVALRSGRAPDARLVLVGGADIPEYVDALRRYAASLGVGDAVEFSTGGISDEALGDRYAAASVYASASDHEGFCLPLLEAMAFSLPVVAYKAGAVAETVGDGGVVLEDRDPWAWSEIIWRMSTDSALRQQLVDAGRRRLADFSDERISKQLDAALGMLSKRAEA